MLVVNKSCHRIRHSWPLRVVGVMVLPLQRMGCSYNYCKYVTLHVLCNILEFWVYVIFLIYYKFVSSLQDMSMKECTKMPTCNLAEIVHNKWLQQSNNKMTCLYEVIVNDLIFAFMQIANHRLWLEGGSIGKVLVLWNKGFLSSVEIRSYWQMQWSFIHVENILAPGVVPWRDMSCLVYKIETLYAAKCRLRFTSIQQSELLDSLP